MTRALKKCDACDSKIRKTWEHREKLLCWKCYHKRFHIFSDATGTSIITPTEEEDLYD